MKFSTEPTRIESFPLLREQCGGSNGCEQVGRTCRRGGAHLPGATVRQDSARIFQGRARLLPTSGLRLGSPLGVRLVITHNFSTSFVLVLNEMVLVLDCPPSRVGVRVLPFGRSTSSKKPGELDCYEQRLWVTTRGVCPGFRGARHSSRTAAKLFTIQLAGAK